MVIFRSIRVYLLNLFFFVFTLIVSMSSKNYAMEAQSLCNFIGPNVPCSTNTRTIELIIQSHQIYQFLKNELKFDLSCLWQDAMDSIFSEQAEIFDTKVWSAKFIEQIEKIRRAINNAFDRYWYYIQKTQNKGQEINLNAIANVANLKEQLLKLNIISDQQSPPLRFDLLSSSLIQAVSTSETSNFFETKNLPIISVTMQNPTMEQFLNGIKRAILSYFDISHLTIRLQSNDSVIFDRPELPLLLLLKNPAQQMTVISFPSISQDKFLTEQHVSACSNGWNRFGTKMLNAYYKGFVFFCLASEGVSLLKAPLCLDSISSLQQKVRFEKSVDDAYKLLELNPWAEISEYDLAKSYRRVQLKYHPDKYKGDDAQEKIIKINEARELLMNLLEKNS